ncbi:acyl-homoserine-lactone synthase [Photobacterium sp.]|uniref:acyl-homoserine-lactone synthase n=1 Tax=Photobacterium sp. TaxID=660 RepID=UPI00299E25A6|nr:acyl-homoserine-lactone synthase [Photobacterium sp.]MDX1303222.1 acyl-homoserine-lactone synthase [Photobacterium sp.]
MKIEAAVQMPIQFNNAMTEDLCRIALFSQVKDRFSHRTRTELFQKLTFKRKAQILQLKPELHSANLATIFKAVNYSELCLGDSEGLPDDLLLIEQAACLWYPHWLAFWCDYEIHDVKAKYAEAPLKRLSPDPLTYEDKDYRGELIDNIETDCRLFNTLYDDAPMKLCDAICLINLELFVRGEEWYEMLFALSLSREGKHFILFSDQADSGIRVIVASALIQDWNQKATWLSLAPQFESEKWTMCLPPHAYCELNRHQLFDPPLMKSCDTASEFNQILAFNLDNTSSICEVLRLTVSGTHQQRLYYLYLTQKLLMSTLCNAGYVVGLTIIEQPFMLNFYKAIDKRAYFHSCYCDINGEGVITYRGFWNFDYMDKVFENVLFRDYKRAVLIGRKNKANL